MAAQLPDIINIADRTMELYSNPLEGYWESTGKSKPKFKTVSDCKRGYVATWAIINNELILTHVDGEHLKPSIFFGNKWMGISLKEIFPKLKGQSVLANWYSGKLRIPDGHMTQYDHNNYNSRFEKEIIITVDKGKVTKIVTLDYNNQRLTVNGSVLISENHK